MSYYVLGSGEVDPRLAIASLSDLDIEFATMVLVEETKWAPLVAKNLGMTTADELPDFSHRDTVIGCPESEALRGALEAGAVCLNINDGLSHLVLADAPEAPAEGVEVPDEIPAPEPEPVREKPAPKARKTAAPRQESKERAVTEGTATSKDALLKRLIVELLAEADEDALWETLWHLKGRK